MTCNEDEGPVAPRDPRVTLAQLLLEPLLYKYDPADPAELTVTFAYGELLIVKEGICAVVNEPIVEISIVSAMLSVDSDRPISYPGYSSFHLKSAGDIPANASFNLSNVSSI